MKKNLLFMRPVKTDGTPDGQLVPIDTTNLAFTPYEVDEKEKELDRLTGKTLPVVGTKPRAKLTYGLYATGSGAPATAPAWAGVLRSCGFAQINEADKVRFVIAEAGFETAENQFYTEDLSKVQTIDGAMGSVKLSMTAGEVPKFEIEQTGNYNDPVAGTVPSPVDWSAWQEGVIATKDNTTELTINGIAHCTNSLEINWNQEVSKRDMPNCKSTTIESAKADGSMTVMAHPDKYLDLFELCRSHNGVLLVPFVWTHGTVDGQKLGVKSSEVQLTQINPDGDDDGDRTISFNLKFIDTPEIITS